MFEGTVSTFSTNPSKLRLYLGKIPTALKQTFIVQITVNKPIPIFKGKFAISALRHNKENPVSDCIYYLAWNFMLINCNGNNNNSHVPERLK